MNKDQPPPPTLASVDEQVQLALLRLLKEHPELTQRELSVAMGISLGKTHYVLRSLVDKGMVKVRNFRRNDRKLAYAYVLTPRGLHEKLRLARCFLARKEAEFEALSATIAQLRREIEASDPAATSPERLTR